MWAVAALWTQDKAKHKVMTYTVAQEQLAWELQHIHHYSEVSKKLTGASSLEDAHTK